MGEVNTTGGIWFARSRVAFIGEIEKGDCPEPESNRHAAMKQRRILNPLCLPVPPSGHARETTFS